MNNRVFEHEVKITDDLEALLILLPSSLKVILETSPELKSIMEIVLDLGRRPEARFKGRVWYLSEEVVNQEDIDFVIARVGQFTTDNRAGIERTLHRISAIRNRTGKIVGLTCRVGRAVFGTIDVIRDVVVAGKNVLIMGRPGIGKTTKLREFARVLADDYGKRVIVVDTSNEIAGDGDIPHPGIGLSRRMQVMAPDQQHAVMIEAVENHMPEVIIVDEIGTEPEAEAARTIAERGVQLVATAHGTTIENLVKNPTLADLVGGIQTVILGDDEARRRGSQKAILERKAPPTFDVLVEIRERDTLAIYHDVAKAVDLLLQGRMPQPEIRLRKEDGQVEIVPALPESEESAAFSSAGPPGEKLTVLKLFPFAIDKNRLLRAIRTLGVPVDIVDDLSEAQAVLTTKKYGRAGSKIFASIQRKKVPLHVIRSSTFAQVVKFLKFIFNLGDEVEEDVDLALGETREAIKQVQAQGKPVDISAQNAYVRRLQHQLIQQEYGLRSESIGEEPARRVRVYPK